MSFSYADQAGSTAAASRSIGGETLQVKSGDGSKFAAGEPTPESPMNLVIYSGNTLRGVLLCSGVEGDVLSIAGPAATYDDFAISTNDRIRNNAVAEDFRSIWEAQIDLGGRVTDAEDAIVDLQSGASSGTVTSVGLSVPSGLSVSNSPVTSSGTIAITTALEGIIKVEDGAFTVAESGVDYVEPSALDGLEPAIEEGTTSKYWRGDKTWQTLPAPSANGLISAGDNVTLTGSGTSGSPYVIDVDVPAADPLSIGSAIESGAGGSILFVDSDGELAQDNTGLYFDATNNRLGVGAASPAAIVDVTANSTADLLRLRSSGGTTLSSFSASGHGFPVEARFVLAAGVDLVAGTNIIKSGWIAPYAGTLVKIKVRAANNGASGGFTLDLKRGGSTILSTPITIAASTTSVTSITTGFASTSIGENDVFTIDASSVGTGVQYVYVTLIYHARNS